MTGEIDAELYAVIGQGRPSNSYEETICYKGRMKETIDFIAAKSIDKRRDAETRHSVQIRYKLKHDKIVQFINWYECKNRLILILEFCPGGTLLNLLERDVCIPETVIRIFAYDILDALFYLHRNSVIFSDLSPRNILLDECGVLKLSGFSKAVTINEKLNTDMIDQELCQYLAPELLDDTGVPSFASDFYALGCLMYHMATGSPPFTANSPSELLQMIYETNPMSIPEMSREFNDLIANLLKRNPHDRPTWEQLIKHKFWNNSLGDCFGTPFAGFTTKMLPRQPEFEKVCKKECNLTGSLDLTRSLRISTVFKPVGQETKPKTATAHDILMATQLLNHMPLASNSAVEKETLPSHEGIAMPVSPSIIRSSDRDDAERAATKLAMLFKGNDMQATKTPLLSWLIKQSRANEVAQNLANSVLLMTLLDCAADTSLPQTVSLFLNLFGNLVSCTRSISNQYIKPESLRKLDQLCSSPHLVIARKAIVALGEVVSFVAKNPDCGITIPGFAATAVVNALRSRDDVIRHYAVLIISNLSRSASVFDSIFDSAMIENLIAGVDHTSFLESFGTCAANFCRTRKLASLDWVVALSKELISSENTNSNIIGLVLAAETETLPNIKSEIADLFKVATGELKEKIMVALSILYKETPSEFIELSQRFFPALEKLQSSSPSIYEPLMIWSIDYCQTIVDTVGNGSRTDMDLLQIVYQAMQIRQFAGKIWTSKFEKKIQKIIRNTPFNTANSEVALQIIQCALCYQVCSISIVSDLCRALNSQLDIVRFTVIKLIADATTQRPIDTSVMNFIESNITTQSQALLQDESCIVEHTLRCLSNASTEKPTIVSSLTKPATLALIISSVKKNMNMAALDLTVKIIKAGAATLNALISAGLFSAISTSLERKENLENPINLLYVTLTMIEKQLSETKSGKRAIVISIHTIATVASRTAMIMLDYPVAGQCLCMLVRIFTPQGSQADTYVDSAFQSLAITLSRGCQKTEYSGILVPVVKVLQWAVETSSAMKLKMRDAASLLRALKKACECGTAELKAAAMACQKAIRR